MNGSHYPSYMASNAEWMGEVPAHWGVDRLKWTVDFARNGVWGEEPDGGDEDILCVRVADFDRVDQTVVLEAPTIRKVRKSDQDGRVLQNGDLLLEKSGGGEGWPVGYVVEYTHDVPAVCSNFIARMKPSHLVRSRFLRYLHHAIYAARVNVRSIKQTSGIQNLDAASYFDELVPYPPLEEQDDIAAFLDRETAKIDALIAEQRTLIAQLQEKRRGLVNSCITRGLDPSIPLRDSEIPWVGFIPEHWVVTPLKWLTDPSRPIMYGIVLPGPDVVEGVPILKGGNVKPSRMNLDSMARTTPEIEEPFARARLKTGDLAYAIRGSIGDCEIVPEELEGSNITQDVARVAPAKGVSGRWLRWALLAQCIREKLASGSNGATIKGVNIFDLKRVRIPTPPPNEQHLIATFLDSEAQAIEQLSAVADAAITLLQEHRSALITATVTGQIDVREAVHA